MKTKTVIFFFFILTDGAILGQTLDRSKPPVLTQSTKRIAGKLKTIYPIECNFTAELSDDELGIAENPTNWQIRGENKVYSISEIEFPLKKNKCMLIGDWDIYDNLSLVFNNQAEAIVNTKDSAGKTTRWGFGKGQAFDFNIQRLTNQNDFYAFDHDFKIKAAERSLTLAGSSIWFRSISLNLSSTGTFASDDKVRNGTQSSIGLALNPFYFVAGLIYRSELNFSYQIETKMNEAEDRLFDVIDKKLKLGVEFEVPLTNYPIFKLHTVTGYARLAIPLTVSLDYLFGGEGNNGYDNFDRLDYRASYELAFSPYLIVQGEWHGAKFFGAPTGFDDTATYYSIAVAQDLDAVKKTLGFLKFILGPEEEIRGNNFIFFRISKGRKAPAFEDIYEKAIGFGTYF